MNFDEQMKEALGDRWPGTDELISGLRQAMENDPEWFEENPISSPYRNRSEWAEEICTALDWLRE